MPSIIAERINDITPDFYRRMFAARPDLMDGMEADPSGSSSMDANTSQ